MIKRNGLPKNKGDLFVWISNLAVRGLLNQRWGKDYWTWKEKDPGIVTDYTPPPSRGLVKMTESDRLVKLASTAR